MKELSAADFDKEINGSTPILVDFWAEWCAPCRILSPILEDLSTSFEGKIKFFKVNVDQEPDLAGKYEIRAIPTIKIFKKGEVIDQFTGAYPKSEIKKKLEAIVK